MSTHLNHDDVHAMISAGEDSPALQEHLADCAACGDWARTLQAITTAAPQLFTSAPRDLSDRIMTTIKGAAGGAAATAVLTRPEEAAAATPTDLRSFMGRRLARTAVAATVAAAVAAAVLIVPRDEPVLAGAVAATRAAQTARFSLTSEFDYRLPTPIPVRVPDVDALGRRIARGLPPQLGGIGDALSDLPEPPAPPPITRIRSSVQATGAIEFGDRIHLAGVGIEYGAGEVVRGDFETIVIGDTTWVRTGLLGPRWIRLPSFPLDIMLDFNTDHLLTAMEGFAGSPTDRGETTLDGERVRHYRFVDARNLGSALGMRSMTVDVWVGAEDGIIRRFRERHTGNAPGRLMIHTEVRFFDIGAAVDIQAPPPGQQTTLDAVVAGFFGYAFGLAGTAFQFSFEAAATMPRFAFPDLPSFKFEAPDIDIDIDIDIPDFEIPDFEIPDFSDYEPPNPFDPGPSPGR